MIPGYPDLMDVICRTYSVTPKQLHEQCKKRDIADIRHILIWAAIDIYGMTLAQAGCIVSRDDSTALNSYSRVIDLKSDRLFAAKLALLTNQFSSLCSTN